MSSSKIDCAMKWLFGWLFCVCLLTTPSAAGSHTSEGTEFAIAMTPCEFREYEAELIVNARQKSRVRISTSSGSDVITVDGNWSTTYRLPYSLRTFDGIENKGILVRSNKPIALHMAAVTTSYSYGSGMPDSYIIRPTARDSVEYYLAAHDKLYFDERPGSSYVIVSSEDNNDVEVHYAENGNDTLPDEHFTLNKYEVFTRDTHHIDGQPVIDFTGTRILANKHVAVFYGAFVELYAEGGYPTRQYISESMPTMDELGTVYTSFSMHFGGKGGYEVRVIAVADGTVVKVPAFSTSLTLDMGEFHTIDNPATDFAFKMTCSKPCMVVQYVRALPEGGDTGVPIGPFQIALTPDDRGSNNLIFTVPTMVYHTYDVFTAAISIIINTNPVTGLHLNDTSLADLDWKPVKYSSNWFATVEVEYGFYHLHSTEPSERFIAYLYTRREGFVAAGFAVGYGETDAVSSPPPHPPPPAYHAILLGNYTSMRGEDFTNECTTDLGNNFHRKAVSMVAGMNNMLGQGMCDYLVAGDVEIVSMSALLKASGSVGVSELAYSMEAASHVSISNLSSCAQELSVHLQDFDNWGLSIVPPVQDCPQLVFDPRHFDGSTGNNWICSSANSDESTQLLEADEPAYSLSIYDNFTTTDGENLDGGCTQDYRMDWQTQVLGMVSTLNDKLDSGELCRDDGNRLTVAYASATFVSQENEGHLNGYFLMTLNTDHIRFDDVNSCVGEIFWFLEEHTNWGPLPLLPQQPECPPLVFAPPLFYHNGESWQCA